MQTVLLLFGGESTEREVSIVSATNVSKAIDVDKYIVVYVFIDPKGEWRLVKDIVEQQPASAKRVLPVLGKGSFIVEGTEQVIQPDVILPIIHGRNGEDGSVQALAQLLHLPIVGCDMTSSAAAMNKYITKEIARANHINIAPFDVHDIADSLPSFESVSEKLGPVLFVKPAGAGSSVGVHKVTSQEELDTALQDAHRHDNVVLIEKALNVRELEVAVLGNYPTIDVSVVGEIKPDGEFYSYESKYDSSSKSEVTIPANLPDELSQQIRHQAAQIFHLLGGSGMARVDFFVDKDTQEIYLNEVNTIPGFTDISMYPKTWEYGGLSVTVIIDKLIALALEKQTR